MSVCVGIFIYIYNFIYMCITDNTKTCIYTSFNVIKYHFELERLTKLNKNAYKHYIYFYFILSDFYVKLHIWFGWFGWFGFMAYQTF